MRWKDSMTCGDVSICIPAYNEADSIENTISELKRVFQEAQIILVDDCSTDNTYELASKINGITVVRHTSNIGYGGALKTATRLSDRPVLAWYDADGQHRPEDLKKVLQPVLDGEMDAVIGARANGSDVLAQRMPGKMILKIVAEAVTRTNIPDLNSGLRCFRTELIKRYMHLLPDGFSASTTSTVVLIMRGYRLTYVPILTRKRIGHSTVKMIPDGLATLSLILKILVLFRAFIFFSILAILQFFPALFYGLFRAVQVQRGFPVLASTVMISGLLTFFLGLVCDQIASLRRERFEDFDRSCKPD